MNKTIYITLLFFSFISPIKAQVDTVFWFAAPEVTELHSDRPIYIRLSTGDDSTNISISIPANPYFIPIQSTIPPNTQYSYELTNYIDSIENEPNTVNNKGILIEANKPIAALYEVFGRGYVAQTGQISGVNTDIFVLKGENALGLEFYIPFQTQYPNYYQNNIEAYSSFDIVATEDSTVVEINLPVPAFGSSSLNRTIVLQRGQTFSFRTTGPFPYQRLTGSHVVSNKPIAITHKDDSIYIPSAWDLLGDQLVPIENIGQTYILIRSSIGNNIDRTFFLATEDDTEITVNGVIRDVINTGETYNLYMNENIYYAETSKPVYATHLTGVDHEAGQALLPSIGDCSGSDQVSFFRPRDVEFRLNIITKNGAQDNFEVNGSPTTIQASDFTVVPNSDNEWVYASIVFDTSQIMENNLYVINNSQEKSHMGVLYGKLPGAFSYGYFSSFSSPLDLGENKTICVGDSIKLDANKNKDSYLWNTGDTTQSISVNTSGEYSVITQQANCTLMDTIIVMQYPIVHEPLLIDSAIYCEDSLFIVSTDTGFVNFMWSEGTTSSMFTPSSSGTYYLDVETINGCRNNDSIHIKIHPLPSPQIIYENDKDIFCLDSIVDLEVSSEYVNYLWDSGETVFQITTPNTYTFGVTVTDTNNCANYTSVHIDCSLFIDTPPNIFTPNGDNMNDYFVVPNIEKYPNSWTLTVTNRLGERVYFNKSYDNSWSGNNLSDGTYFYLLQNNNLKNFYKGWVQILR